MPEKITWSVKVVGPKLRIEYTYENQGEQVVYVNDGLAVQVKDKLWDARKMQRYEKSGADTILITIGLPTGGGAAPPRGVYAKVPAGGSHTSAREIAWPLVITTVPGTAQTEPLTGITKAALDIEVIDGEPPSWIELPVASGTIKIPDGPPIRVVHAADTLPLPR